MKKIFKTLPVFFASLFLGIDANAQWSLTGNSTSDGNNIIGTTNQVNVIFKRGDLETMSFKTFSPGGGLTIPYVHVSNGLKIGSTGGFNGIGASLQINNDLEVGARLSKATDAGKLYYGGSSTSAHFLSIYGGGTTTTNRVIKFYNEGGASFSGSVRIGAEQAVGTHSNYALSVDGKLLAKSIYITADVDANWWPDFVFKNNYKLTPLNEVEAYIKKEGHLKGIPTTQEVMEKGIDIAQVNAGLLQKVEELTLYMIEMKKEINSLKATNATLTNSQK
ncbi:MAG TPA: hypothetical protein VF691_15460 [Cytophagaceae bacterium]|jgi:hypothetical protein